ncbi:Ribonuclease HII [Rickettsiales bacterium Ac37b]|nr:Ribonuclease HII [Rickettsiales bacterium Ac37b]
MIYKPHLLIESKYQYLNKPVAGIDEAGRGPWAGPMVAAVVILDPNAIPEGINDSKKLTIKQRTLIFQKLIQVADFGIGIVSVEEIDLFKITASTTIAMNRAIEQLRSKPSTLLLDGNAKLQLNVPEIVNIVKGDSQSLSIAAASIIAKVTRDQIMYDLAKEFPMYNWNTNVGYGTKDHINAINSYGICKYHRKTFAPIQKFLS